MTALTVIILAKDEARHITRAIASVQEIATEVVVVDSGSTDDTVTLAKAAGARVLHNPWTNYATQFNWLWIRSKAILVGFCALMPTRS